MGRSLAVDDSARHLSGARQELLPARPLAQRHLRRVRAGFRLDSNAVRRAALFRYGAMATIAVASLAMLGAWGWSYTSNKSLISTAGAAVEDYRIAAKEELSRKEISGAERFPAAISRSLPRISASCAPCRPATRIWTSRRRSARLSGWSSATGCSRHRRSLPQRAGADVALATDPAAGAADHRLHERPDRRLRGAQGLSDARRQGAEGRGRFRGRLDDAGLGRQSASGQDQRTTPARNSRSTFKTCWTLAARTARHSSSTARW